MKAKEIDSVIEVRWFKNLNMVEFTTGITAELFKPPCFRAVFVKRFKIGDKVRVVSGPYVNEFARSSGTIRGFRFGFKFNENPLRRLSQKQLDKLIQLEWSVEVEINKGDNDLYCISPLDITNWHPRKGIKHEMPKRSSPAQMSK